MKKFKIAFSLLAVLMIVTGEISLHAQTSITVPNFSFQTVGSGSYSTYPGTSGGLTATPSGTSTGGYDQVYTQNTSGYGTILPGWTIAGSDDEFPAAGYQIINVASSNAYTNAFTSAGTSDGNLFAFLNLDYPITLTSTNLGTVADNTTYSLTVAIGVNNSGGNTSSGYVAPGNEFISLLDNGTPLATDSLSQATLLGPGDSKVGTFTDYTLTYTTSATDPLGNLSIQLGGSSTGGAVDVAQFDNVRLTEIAVPEPSAYALMAAGLASLGFFARRKLA